MTMTGKKHSEETREKMRLASTGNKNSQGTKHSEESREKIRQGQLNSYKNGRIPYFQGKKPWNTGIPNTLEVKMKISAKLSGDKNPNWKGGITPLKLKIRTSPEYREWRLKVYENSNYACVQCGIKGDLKSPYLHADHIKSFHLNPELRLDVNNGRVLCLNCHVQTETFGRKQFKSVDNPLKRN